ncbi:G patch domain-containing protein 4-like [Dreissena polymorpha]|nr:G patch domain-containing protein 4-like [Dreissena polymorpha]
MDFAERQLQKHGWQAGDGLGKEKTGIKEAIKVKIKNDNRGVGHDSGREFTYHWWDHVFNKTADNIQIQESKDGVEIKNNNTTGTQAKAKPLADKSMLYGQFVKGATLSDGRENKPEGHVSENSEDEEEIHQPCLVPDREEEVFKMCGGRTAHKGARHGLKLNGKLQRIEEQERLAQLKPAEVTNGNMIRKKSSKPSKETSQEIIETNAIGMADAGNFGMEHFKEKCGTKTEADFENCDEEMKKKSKKNKKSKKKDKTKKEGRGSVVDNEVTECKLVHGNTDIIIKDTDTQNNLTNGKKNAPLACELRNADAATHVVVENKRKRKKKKKEKYNDDDIEVELANTFGKTESVDDASKFNKLKRKKNRE